MKPQRAADAKLEELPYPMWFLPKIDGVRGLKPGEGPFVGRSLDPFEGFGVTELFSRTEYTYFDGEITLGDNPRAENLCSQTTGALARIYVEGAKTLITEVADYHWWLFDYVDPEVRQRPYAERYELVSEVAKSLQDDGHHRLHVVPFEIVNNMEEAKAAVDRALNMNYEGGIFRNPRAGVKEDKPSKKHMEYMRVKPWLFDDILITGFREGEKNNNAKKVNSLGRTERSSAKEGKVPNGEIGAVIGKFLRDVIHPFNGRKLFEAGVEYEFGPGRLTTLQAKHFFQNPSEFVGQFAEVKHLAHGVKDKPRMGTFERLRLKQDIIL
jgi:DNA ligase-1